MTENTDETEPEDESDVQIDLAAPDEVAYDELVDAFGEELVAADLNEVVKQRIRSMYDNQDQIRQQLAQAQRAAGPPQ